MENLDVIVNLPMGKVVELSVPAAINADALVTSLYAALCPNIPCKGYIRSENPVALICGSTPMSSFGLHNGTILYMN